MLITCGDDSWGKSRRLRRKILEQAGGEPRRRK